MLNQIIIPEKNFLFTSQNSIQEICKPLFASFDITYFEYLRIYTNGSRTALCTNSLKVKHLLETENLEAGYDFSFVIRNLDYYLWQDMVSFMPKKAQNSLEQKVYETCSLFNIDNGITILEKSITHVDFFQFGSTPNNTSMPSFYLNNIDVLQSFILYFKDKADKLIKLSNINKIPMPRLFNATIEQPVLSNELKQVKNQYFKSIDHNRYFLNKDLSDIYLTKRELECISLLATGKTAKEIGRRLELSPRTIESFINNMKLKFQCNTLAQILKIYWESNLKEILI